MAADTLKDFFVSLGFKVEKGEERKFNDSIKSATLQATLLADSLEGAVKAVAKAVASMAADFETLYYQAERTNTTVTGIKSISYALQQTGVSAGEAASSIAGFTKSLAVDPSTESFLRYLKVETRDANKQLLSTQKIMEQLGPVFRRLPLNVAEQYASRLGISYNTMRAFRDHGDEIKRYQESTEATAKAIGLDQDAAAKKSKDFMNALRDLMNTVSLVATKFFTDLAPALQKFIEQIDEYIKQHPEEIKATLEGIAKGALHFAESCVELAHKLEPVIDTIGRWAKSITGDENSLTAVMTVFSVWLLASWLPNILKVFGLLGGGWVGLLARLGIVGALAMDHYAKEGKALAHGGTPDRGMNAGDDLPGMGGGTASGEGGGNTGGEGAGSRLGRAGRAVKRFFGGSDGMGARARRAEAQNANLREPSQGGRPARGALARNQAEAYKAARDLGYDDSSARALVANLSGEALNKPGDYHWDRTHMASGIAQWDPTRSARIKAQFGSLPHQMSVTDQVKALDWELKTRPEYAATRRALADPSRSAASKVGTLVTNFERPQDTARATSDRLVHLAGFHPEKTPGTQDAPGTPPTLPPSDPPSGLRAPGAPKVMPTPDAAPTASQANLDAREAARVKAWQETYKATGDATKADAAGKAAAAPVIVKPEINVHPDAPKAADVAKAAEKVPTLPMLARGNLNNAAPLGTMNNDVRNNNINQTNHAVINVQTSDAPDAANRVLKGQNEVTNVGIRHLTGAIR